MQYHLNGFRPGDPHRAPDGPPDARTRDGADVIVVGCGPAGIARSGRKTLDRNLTTGEACDPSEKIVDGCDFAAADVDDARRHRCANRADGGVGDVVDEGETARLGPVAA